MARHLKVWGAEARLGGHPYRTLISLPCSRNLRIGIVSDCRRRALPISPAQWRLAPAASSPRCRGPWFRAASKTSRRPADDPLRDGDRAHVLAAPAFDASANGMCSLANVRAGGTQDTAQDANMAGTVSVAGRSNRMTIGLRPELQIAGAEGPRDPIDPPSRDRPEPPLHDPPPNPPEPDQPFGDPTPLPGNDPPDPPMRFKGAGSVRLSRQGFVGRGR